MPTQQFFSYIMARTSCGIVVLYGPFFFWRTIGLRISPYQKLSKMRSENVAPLLCKLLSWNRVWERSNIYICDKSRLLWDICYNNELEM